MVGSEKLEGWKKVSLYKFTHIPLLKNDAQLKKKDKQLKKNHPNLLNNKNYVQKKKSCLINYKKKNITLRTAQKIKRKKDLKKKRVGIVLRK